MDKNKDYKVRLERHIKALDTAYDNIIALLEEEIEREEDKEKGGEKIKLKDSQRKVYADGVDKCAKTADDLLAQIKSKQDELDKLNKPIKQPKNGDKVEEVVEEEKDHQLEKHLK